MSVSDWAGSIGDWRQALEDMKKFIAPAFKRSEQRLSASAFTDGSFSGAEGKTGWMLAESGLNNSQASDFVDKRTDFVGCFVQGLLESLRKPCNFEP